MTISIMGKQETIQIRIDSDLKDQFFKYAEGRKLSPSELIRQIMTLTVNEDFSIPQEFDGIYQTLIVIIQILFKTSYKEKDDALFNEINNNPLYEYLSEMVGNHARFVVKEHGADYNKVIKRELETNLDLEQILEKLPTYKKVSPSSEVFKLVREQNQKKNDISNKK